MIFPFPTHLTRSVFLFFSPMAFYVQYLLALFSLEIDGHRDGGNVEGEAGRVPRETGVLLVAQIRRVRPVGPIEDDFLVRGTGLLEEVVVVRVVQVAPDA